MCLIAFAWRAHPRYKLVFAANRDEFHQRPADAACFWPEAPKVLAGRDLTQGGAWCGVTRTGRIAAVTNYRDPSLAEAGKRSRGHLVRDYLMGARDAEAEANEVESRKQQYSEFNLLLGDQDALWYVGSRTNGPQPVSDGVHGISNGAFDLAWPKVRHASAGVETALAANSISPDVMFETLSSRHVASDDDLPDTGVGLQLERFLSAPFIVSETYGTRASTVILIGHDGATRFVERRFDANGDCTGETDERFLIED